MKKSICLIMIALLLFSLAACDSGSKTYTTDVVSSTSSADNNSSAASSEASDAVVSAALDSAKSASSASANADDTDDAKSSDGIDVDLTKMSSTMVYSEVLNMQQTPEKYLGKTVKMHGPFNVTELNDNRYFACLITDATACCSTGIEFVLSGDYSYPDDYPPKDTEIIVTGTFTTYKEGKSQYLQLKDAEMEVPA